MSYGSYSAKHEQFTDRTMEIVHNKKLGFTMVTEQLYNDIAKRYGKVASWAVWAEAGDKPKSNISDMEILI